MVEARSTEDSSATRQAHLMLDAFASVGADRFDLTHINIDGEKRGFRKSQSIRQLKNSLPYLLASADERINNVIVRPVPSSAQIIQLDDLDAAKLERVEPVAFLTLQTSPGNHQAWVALRQDAADQNMGPRTAGDSAADLARRLRKGAGADMTASGATRVAGTRNYKRKYEPEFPTVTILDVAPGRIVTAQQLEQAGLLAAPDPIREARKVTPLHSSPKRKWPSYEMCLAGAPPNHGNTGPDVSRADYTWCLTASNWGFETDDIAARLMEVSEKAKENGERYAELTARNAAAAQQRRQMGKV